MKRLLSIFSVVLVSMILLACGSGGGGGGGEPGEGSPEKEVSINGRVFNERAVAGLDVYGDPEILAVSNIPYSILNSGCSQLRPIYMNSVSQGETLSVEWTIENNTENPLYDIEYIVEFENAETMHRESWTCNKWYDRLSGNGSAGHSIWEQSGGYFYNAIASPSLPTCESPMTPAVDICDPLDYDCLNPWWSIEHNEASGGCTQATGYVSIRSHESASGMNSYSNSNIDIRAGHLARFQAIYNGRIMDEKCYIFEVMP